MADSFRLRPLAPADLEHLWTMQWEPLPRQISTFYLLCVIGHPHYCSVAVDPADRIVGVLLTTGDDARRWVYVNHLRIEPDWRGRGVGQALMARLEQQCHGDRLSRIWLLTGEQIEPFYARMGFARDDSFMPPTVRELMVRHRPDTVILSKTL